MIPEESRSILHQFHDIVASQKSRFEDQDKTIDYIVA